MGLYGYYGVIVSDTIKEDKENYYVRVLCEDASINRILVSKSKHSRNSLKEGKILIYTKSYYWRACYLDTDIKIYNFQCLDLIRKVFLDHEELTEDEMARLKDDELSYEIYLNLSKQSIDIRDIWFDTFVYQNIGVFNLETTDDDYEMLREYYHLEA